MTSYKKTAIFCLVLMLVFGLTAVSFAGKDDAQVEPKSVAPLYQRPGDGEGVIKDQQAQYPEDGKYMPPRVREEGWPLKQLPSSLYLAEDFEGAGFPPTGWTLNQTNLSETWVQGSFDPYNGFYYADCVYDPALVPQDEWLVTPSMDLTAASAPDLRLNFAVLLSYYWSVDPNNNYDLEVWVSTDGGATFTTKIWDETALGLFTNFIWYEQEVSLSAYAGQANFALGFRYVGVDGAEGAFDFISVNDDPPPTGRCCYGDPLSPTCSDETFADCATLGGVWDETLSCLTDPCPVAAGGDDCGSPLTITLPASSSPATVVSSETTCGRGNDYSATCLGSYDGGEEIIIEVQVLSDITVNITLDPKGTTWTGIAIDDTCPLGGSGACVAYITSSSGAPKTLSAVNLVAGTYYIMVDTWPTPNCVPDFDIIVEEIVVVTPPNDDCANAEPIGDVTNLPFSTMFATTDGPLGCQQSPNVWYVYTASCTGNAIFSLCGSDYDTKMTIYDGPTCTGTELACNDDECGLQSEIIIPVVAGQQYLVEVGGYFSSFSGPKVGDGVLTTSCYIPPPNDNCEDVTPVTTFPAVVTGDNSGATNQCTSFPGNHVWEAFTIDECSDVTISYAGTTPPFGNAWLNLALGCPCAQFTDAGSFDFAGDGNVRIHWSQLQPGTYYYPVLEEPGASGPYTLTISIDNVYPEGCYCTGSGGCDEFISRVQIGDIDNSSSCNEYEDWTALSTVVYQGLSYNLTVTNGPPNYSSDQCGVWVDWNQDKDFDDAGEQITVSGVPGVGPYTATITPPIGATNGPTVMRVRITYTGAVLPCGGTTYGEVEDYTLEVDSYVCGDCDGDDVLTNADITCMIDYYFNGGAAPVPINAGDNNGDGNADIADIVYLANHLIFSGAAPVCPF